MNENEPELGLGILLTTEYGRVEMLFPAADERRLFALESAPLKRVQFKAGDRIATHEGENRIIEAVREENGLLVYETKEGDIPEAQLSDQISVSSPEDRLLAGQVDEPDRFDLRLATLRYRGRIRRSPVRGYTGARISLIAHQLSIVAEVSGRLRPRVLLADEVGLGKTIEACLILHRLHLCGRADRILILLPESLVNQWFIEVMRRFNLMFSIYDEERCQATESGNNPFLDSQLVIVPVNFLAENPERAAQALEAEWDLLIVDEAHHLEWTPEHSSAKYNLVAALAAQTEGLLLLTATPQQLGAAGHFARLRLLDPDRYTDLDQFLEEQGHYEEVADLVDSIKDGKKLAKSDLSLLGKMSSEMKQSGEKLDSEASREALVNQLLDSFGTGRVLFRNRRASLEGFPERKAHLALLENGHRDTRIDWLMELLLELEDAKVLLICHSKLSVEKIAEGILNRRQLKLAQFHEGLTLLQRDRNAAFFAEEDGARILLCSEIGSEGRNFQFAHHLVLFDLPEDPELLEQRIGRLDRIGQTETIHIHVPHAEAKGEAVQVRFYHEGLDAFEKSLPGATEIVRECAQSLEACMKKADAKKMAALLKQAKEVRERVISKLERGQDRLLALNSARPGQAAACAKAIRAWDDDRAFETFVMELFETQGVQVEEYGGRCYKLSRGYHREELFASIPEDGQIVTFSREHALSREDQSLMGCDHPLIRGAMDSLLASEEGNAAFGVLEAGIDDDEEIILEVVHVLECVAPPALHADRFLPPTPVLSRIDHRLESLEESPFTADDLQAGHPHGLINKDAFRRELFPDMINRATEFADEKRVVLIKAARRSMTQHLNAEIDRLKALKKLNDHISQEEIEALITQRNELDAAIKTARLRCEAIRLVWKK